MLHCARGSWHSLVVRKTPFSARWTARQSRLAKVWLQAHRESSSKFVNRMKEGAGGLKAAKGGCGLVRPSIGNSPDRRSTGPLEGCMWCQTPSYVDNEPLNEEHVSCIGSNREIAE